MPAMVAGSMLRALAAGLGLAALALAPPGAAADRLRAVAASGGGAELSVDFAPAEGLRAGAFAVLALADPPRVAVDLPLTDWAIAPPAPPPGALWRGLRYGLAAPGRSRLVLDLAAPAQVTAARLTPLPGGARLTLLLAPADAAMADPPAAPAPRAQAGLVIAIDPGHGGPDPGASRGGLVEKTLTLDFARDLAAALAAAGHRPVLTRQADIGVSLRARLALARAAGAQALLSIHADAAPQPEVEGASVYTLSARASDALAAALAQGDARAERLAAAVFPGLEAGLAVPLTDLARRETAQDGAALGDALLGALGRRVPVLPGRPLRAAGFQILTAPDIPAALVELGFLSSAADRARLTDPAWRAEAVAALVEGLEAWARGR